MSWLALQGLGRGEHHPGKGSEVSPSPLPSCARAVLVSTLQTLPRQTRDGLGGRAKEGERCGTDALWGDTRETFCNERSR